MTRALHTLLRGAAAEEALTDAPEEKQSAHPSISQLVPTESPQTGWFSVSSFVHTNKVWKCALP